MSIRFRDRNRIVNTISQRQFHNEFGVEYRFKLKLPHRLPKVFLDRCANYGLKTAEQMNPRERRAYERKVSRGYVAPCYIAKVSDAIGYGLFAGRDIRPGEMVGEYVGLLTLDWSAEPRKPSDVKPYLFRYPFDCDYAVDAERHGNETRFINHSTESNVGRRYIFTEGIVHTVLIAEKAIVKNTQFLLDYGKKYWRFHSPAKIKPLTKAQIFPVPNIGR